MRNISTILSVLALVLTGVLFYLHFNGNKELKKVSVEAEKTAHNSFRIGYFDIDSLQNHYEYFKDVLEQMKKKEASMNNELNQLNNQYQRRVQQLQSQMQSLGQAITEADQLKAQNELATMQRNFGERKASLEQDMQKTQVENMATLRKTVEDYLKDYNKDKGYAFILSYEPGLLMYYKDTMYDVTGDLIKGLNAQYAAKKGKP
ncbi:OmpH family outer membrane protein [Pseudobacter ginsenosidimutans]|uniref:Periplasmic chaperone for outer membrane proteins Skp n=1 Tax=Pseudobacter ginsenosidimutans TaxID=661488 RepID=A0A4Q7MLF7_9BACT|nr:OmpH family outer membrane protein [Pseudobacter ginsenosidimutans]QEC40208.1 OmpH family outer membrane protein [Pseudobacter ginsenosidimutans]RZS69195.1 periplasmic chaperone for outer membrane proteins Skp [Pseudobacter ginsenosidimutans]